MFGFMRMINKVYKIRAIWDAEAKVWVASSDDVPGLVAEAATVELLLIELKALIPELLELNAHKDMVVAKRQHEKIKFKLCSEVDAIAAF